MRSYLSLNSISCDKKLCQWQLRNKGITSPIVMSLRQIRAVTQGRNLKVETKAEVMEGYCLLVNPREFPWLIFLYNPGQPTQG